jgi:hypothetical protein
MSGRARAPPPEAVPARAIDHYQLRRAALIASSMPGATGFAMGLEDSNGQRAWASSDTVGGVPRPFDQSPGSTKSMLTTLRFPVRCFRPEKERLDLGAVQALLVRYDRADNRALGFDVLQIVRE